MSTSIDDFLKNFTSTKCYDIKHVDLEKLTGAMLISDNIDVYKKCSFLGIRVIGYTSIGSTIYANIQEIEDVIKSNFIEDCINIIVFEHYNISPSITDEELDALYKKYFDQGKVIFIHGRDSLQYFLYAVNEFRSIDPNYC